MIQQAAERVRQMEHCFDILQRRFREDPSAFRRDAECQTMMAKLIRYYEGGQWQKDYALDEQGLLPTPMCRCWKCWPGAIFTSAWKLAPIPVSM